MKNRDLHSGAGSMKTIGVLALQGAVEKHINMINMTGSSGKEVYTEEDLHETDALIIPGGESTTIGKLILKYKLDSALETLIAKGLPVFGTCAGLILLVKNIQGSEQYKMNFLDITVSRNAYGSQKESFETDLTIDFSGKEKYRGVFIRAPKIIEHSDNVEVLCYFENHPVLIKQNNILGACFHPELTDDNRIHKFFIDSF
jgi:5'-phosphate synthase pdxT subunit